MRIGGEISFWSDITQLRRRLSPDAHIQIGFSSTEATGTQWFVPHGALPVGPRVPVGYMLPGNRFALAAGPLGGTSTVRIGEAGHLFLRGRSLALGHWQDGHCVPGPMSVDPADPEARIFYTGDLMRLGKDGLLDAVGRADDQVKIRGQRVEPSEVEAVLRGLPEVGDAAVLVRRETEGETALVAFFTGSQATADEALAAELRARLRDALPAAMQPARIHPLTEIPRLPSAKPDRGAMEQLDRERVERAHAILVPAPTPPATAPALLPAMGLAFDRAWSQLLDDRSLVAHMPFDEAGGDSLGLGFPTTIV